MPLNAAQPAAIVAFIDERRARGVTRDEACRLAGVSARNGNRWRLVLHRHGVRALTARNSRPKRTKSPWKSRQTAAGIEHLRGSRPLGKEDMAVLLRR